MSGDNAHDLYRPFVTKLHNQWLARETWCETKAPIPQHQRRHYKHRESTSSIKCFYPNKNKPFTCSDRSRGVIFPPPRRVFPSIRNTSSLGNLF